MEAATSAARASGLEPLELSADSVAAAALFQRHSAHVFRYCNARLRKREDAEDAVQTTFLYAFRSLRQGVEPLVESAWLLGIARNVCLARWEASGRRNRLEAVCDPDVLARGAAAPQSRREELIGLESALAGLPERQRRAVLLRDWRGLSYDEVAEQLGVSRAAVETLIFRGRERLAALLREEPSTIRRRLGSLANLGALVNAVKTALAGGAAGTKFAAAVTVVAVSGAGAGVAAGPLLDRGAPAPTRPDVARPAAVQSQAAAAAVAPPDVRSGPARVAPAARATPPARKSKAAPAAPRSDRPSAAPVDTSATAAAPAAAAPRVSVPESPPRSSPPVAASLPAPKREQSPPAVPLVQTPPAPEVLPAVITVVDEVVETVVPGLPAVSLPEAAELPVVGPVTEDVVETVEQVVAPLLPTLPVRPPAVVPDLPLLPLFP
jgi:RNA polymerase sigma factor (sigma-70 family)